MNYFKTSLRNTYHFLHQSNAYFRDVLLMHSFMLFILIPLLSNTTRFILHRGNLPYLSYDNIGQIIMQHPLIALSLLLILFSILLAIYFEFTFLLFSVYFIKKEEPIRLKQLLHLTILQIKKLKPSAFGFFLFYFFLILPLGTLAFRSDLLAKIKIPAFIMDFIFANRFILVLSFIVVYLLLIYIGSRLIFALPMMILKDQPLKLAVRSSLNLTRKRSLAIIGQVLFISMTMGALLLIIFTLLITTQAVIEEVWPHNGLISAVIIMTILQIFLLINTILSTVGVFYVIVDFLALEKLLPPVTTKLSQVGAAKKPHTGLKITVFILLGSLLSLSVGLYNYDYLTTMPETKPVTVSHRGVSHENGVQNTIAALKKTHNEFKPDYVEMDIQQTSDGQFVVYHDFNYKALTGVRKKPSETTLAETQTFTIKENGQTAKVDSFDDYLAAANEMGQKLLIEIKTQEKEPQKIVNNFLARYADDLRKNGHTVQSLSFALIDELKQQAPDIVAGYILPFNLVGPPTTKADFLTMEYSTLTRGFIETAHDEGKEVYVWTPNDDETMNRMIFYGVDGIITDEMAILNDELTNNEKQTYSDKLLNFVIGVG